MSIKDHSYLLILLVPCALGAGGWYFTGEWWPLILTVPTLLFALVSVDFWLAKRSKSYAKWTRSIGSFIGEVAPVVGGCLFLLVLAGGMLKSCTSGSDHCGAQEAKYFGCD